MVKERSSFSEPCQSMGMTHSCVRAAGEWIAWFDHRYRQERKESLGDLWKCGFFWNSSCLFSQITVKKTLAVLVFGFISIGFFYCPRAW